jgi:hypothetical protein
LAHALNGNSSVNVNWLSPYDLPIRQWIHIPANGSILQTWRTIYFVYFLRSCILITCQFSQLQRFFCDHTLFFCLEKYRWNLKQIDFCCQYLASTSKEVNLKNVIAWFGDANFSECWSIETHDGRKDSRKRINDIHENGYELLSRSQVGRRQSDAMDVEPDRQANHNSKARILRNLRNVLENEDDDLAMHCMWKFMDELCISQNLKKVSLRCQIFDHQYTIFQSVMNQKPLHDGHTSIDAISFRRFLFGISLGDEFTRYTLADAFDVEMKHQGFEELKILREEILDHEHENLSFIKDIYERDSPFNDPRIVEICYNFHVSTIMKDDEPFDLSEIFFGGDTMKMPDGTRKKIRYMCTSSPEETWEFFKNHKSGGLACQKIIGRVPPSHVLHSKKPKNCYYQKKLLTGGNPLKCEAYHNWKKLRMCVLEKSVAAYKALGSDPIDFVENRYCKGILIFIPFHAQRIFLNAPSPPKPKILTYFSLQNLVTFLITNF